MPYFFQKAKPKTKEMGKFIKNGIAVYTTRKVREAEQVWR